MCPSGELVPQSLPHPSPPSGAITAPLGTRLARGLPPLPRWSEAITPGVYPGRDPPLPSGDTPRCRRREYAHPTYRNTHERV
jgi:hypothetical protein